MDILNTNPSTLLEQFQNAYFDQIGARMTIGSEEYTLSSIFTYVLSMYAGLINNSYDNQNLDTASGIFLDNIAARYNLNRTPEVYSNPWFEGYFKFDKNSIHYNKSYDKGTMSIIVDNHAYTNESDIVSFNNQVEPQPVRWVAIEPHTTKYSAIELYEKLVEAKDAFDNTLFEFKSYGDAHLTSMNSVASSLDDSAFREYIKRSKRLYMPGVAGSFEALAKSCSDNVVDARVRVQTDKGFIKGNVDLYCKFYNYNEDDIYWSTISNMELPYIERVIKEKNILVIGQNLNVKAANRLYDKRNYAFFVNKVYNTSVYQELYNLKFKAACGYLNNKGLKVGEDYFPTRLIVMMTQPLSQFSNDPHDFGWNLSDIGYKKFDEYKDLPVIGLASISSMNKQTCDPTSNVYISRSSQVKFVFTEQGENL